MTNTESQARITCALLTTCNQLHASLIGLLKASMVLYFASLALAAAFLLLAQISAFAPYVLAMMGGAVALLFPNTFTWLARTLPGARGGTALLVAGALLGGALFPALISRVVAAFGERMLPTAMLVLAVAALMMTAWLRRTSRRHDVRSTTQPPQKS